MQWAGKAFGGIVGLLAGGPWGSLLGLVLGHQFDVGVGERLGGRSVRGAARTRALFFEATFATMGHIAKSDGRVSEDEIRAARRVMHGMALSPEQVSAAIEHFTRGKSAAFRVNETTDRLAETLRGRRDLVRAFVEIQLQAAIAGGGLDRDKRDLIWSLARRLGMGRVELAQIEALVRAQQAAGTSARRQAQRSLEDAYRVLGVEPGAPAKDVKLAYRRLMSQHHPDKLVARGLPESMKANAEQKTREIRAAYDSIKAQRKLS